MSLNGRDQHGFVIGSSQSRQAAKLYERAMASEELPPETRATLPRKGGRIVDHAARLVEPAWHRGEAEVTKNRRHRDRLAARASSLVLGVPVPEWAQEGPPVTRGTRTLSYAERMRWSATQRRSA